MALTLAGLLAACGGSGGGGDSLFSENGASAPGGGASAPGGAASGPGSPSGGTTPGGGISTVSSGVPNQRFMSISVEKRALNWSVDGDTTDIRVSVADSAGNPVPAGTVVQFSTEGGQIQTSCALTGVAQGASTISACSVTFSTQDFRPLDGFVRVVAWLDGQEAFLDSNADGMYTSGEPFVNSGAIFRDDDDDGVFTQGVDELNIAGTIAGQPGIGSGACAADATVPVNSLPLSVADTCDGGWGRTLVRASTRLPVSNESTLGARVSGANVTVFSTFNGVEVAAPTGTTLTVRSTPVGCTAVISPAAVSATAVTATTHLVSATTAAGGPCSGNVGVDVKFGDSTAPPVTVAL